VLPFVFIDESGLGPFHVYGVAVALGFFAWDWAVMRQGVRRGHDRQELRALTVWALGMGTFFAWWIDAVFYRPAAQPLASSLLSMQGFSSVGGIVGATVGALLWRHVRIGRTGSKLGVSRRPQPLPLLPAADVIVSTWPLGWAFGRLGCALIHDHIGARVAPGTLGSLFAVGVPRDADDGIHRAFGPLHVVTGGSDVRLDLGLIEFVVLTVIAIGFAFSWKREVRVGTFTIAGCLAYGPIRFVLDFAREHEGPTADLRHFGLTFAQYFSLAIILLAAVLLAKRRLTRGIVPTPDVAVEHRPADETRTAIP
jgi:phosphatidylglycerol---prolipoprotein diacylglyceryl transferase